MNVYSGLTGRVENFPEPDLHGAAIKDAEFTKSEPREAAAQKRPSDRTGILKGLGGIFSKVLDSKPELEDLLLIGVLYLLYRESGDIEFLLIAGAMLFM